MTPAAPPPGRQSATAPTIEAVDLRRASLAEIRAIDLRGRERDLWTDEAAFRSTDGWGWTYENLTGHVRSHLAMIAPWCVRTRWPGGLDTTR